MEIFPLFFYLNVKVLLYLNFYPGLNPRKSFTYKKINKRIFRLKV